jgi:hypothetical protein
MNKGIFQISDVVGGIKNNTLNTLALFYNGTDFGIYFNNTYTSVPFSIALSTWYHLALVRHNNITTLYVNGNSILSAADNADYTGTYLAIGGYYQPGYFLPGRVDEFRVSNGIARWETDFTPLPVPYSETPPIIANITLISKSVEADTIPNTARVVALIEPIESILMNTDIKVFVSEDDGVHYEELSMVDETYFDSTKIVYAASKNLTDYDDKTLRYTVLVYFGNKI